MLSKNSLGSEHFKDQNKVRSFICTVCHHVPHPDIAFELIECGHILCEGCLNALRQTEQPCPNCKRAIGYSYRSLKADNKVAYRLLMDLAVKCPKQCSWSGAWSSLDEHLANCEKVRAYNNYVYRPFEEISDEREENERLEPGCNLQFSKFYVKNVHWSIPREFPEKGNMGSAPGKGEGGKGPSVSGLDDIRLGDKYKVSVHKHLLTYIKKEGWACNGMSIFGGCKSKFAAGGFGQTKGERRFTCSDCHYDLCQKCVEAYLIR